MAAQNGVGLGYVMEADVREDIAAGRLVRVPEDWTPSLSHWRCIILAGRTYLLPSVRLFRQPAISRTTDDHETGSNRRPLHPLAKSV